MTDSGQAVGRGAGHAAWRSFRDIPDLLRLLGVRLLSQYTEGLFQAALGSAIVFNPERNATPAAIAGGLAVLLLPYSAIGPFAGALLDHWDRRKVFIVANLIRTALILLCAAVLGAGAGETAIFVVALAVGGAGRFVASGLSAALPHVVDRPQLVAMNSVTTTLGAGATALGAGTAVGLRAIFGSDDAGSGAVLGCAALVALCGAALSARFRPGVLGPDHDVNPPGVRPTALRDIGAGLAHGALAAWRAPSVTAALSGMGAHRTVFGFNTLMLLLLTRHHFTDGTLGLAGFGAVAGATAVGMFVAAVITPLSVARWGRRTTVVGALVVACLTQLTVLTLDFLVLVIAAGVLGVAGQVVKLSGDAAMQLDVPDERRGQVFSFQDALFNTTFVAAVSFAAAVVPFDGASRPLAAFGAVIYAVSVVTVLALYRRKGTPAPAGASN
ncbi:MFS transporter [Tsukamurella sp. 1534]|uniref:MFS transporter n=1 Tax=Tsukamurella sp. 1534 TaxID=1151061 RepID=UPI00068775EE|nr:MFS transporter [Tsukamurella sp. 1534]